MRCFDLVFNSGHLFQVNHCLNTITCEAERSDVQFTRESLFELSKTCFNLYKGRLENISRLILNLGTEEYELINAALIDLILAYNPLKFSFSITEDPSIHFFIRFEKDIALFIETYLDTEEGNDTYVQILKSEHTLFEQNALFDDVMEGIQEVLLRQFPKKSEVFQGTFFSKSLELC